MSYPTEETMREYLGEAWARATGLTGDDSPLMSAIIVECLEATEPKYTYEDIADTLRTIAGDCQDFADKIEEEAEA